MSYAVGFPATQTARTSLGTTRGQAESGQLSGHEETA
jgi:hypothetical protein